MLLFAGMASAATMATGVHSVNETRPPQIPIQALLIGSDFGLIRRQALSEHPIGSRIDEVADAFGKLGFSCRFRPHLIEDTTTPTVLCRSTGQGTTLSSRLDLTLVARNGTLTDIAVSNGLDGLQASAEQPDPNPGGEVPAAAIPPLVPDPEWDAILREAGKRYARPLVPIGTGHAAEIKPAPRPESDGKPPG